MSIPGLRLALPTAALAEQVLTWRSHPDVLRWYLTTTVDAEEMIADWGAWDPEGYYAVVAVLDGIAVGIASVRVTDGMGQTGHEPEFVGREGWIGYAVDPACSGRGLGTLLARHVLDHAFGPLGLRRVQAGCFADNTASWRVMEKLGMRREQHGVKDSFHAELGWLDGYTYAILGDEW